MTWDTTPYIKYFFFVKLHSWVLHLSTYLLDLIVCLVLNGKGQDSNSSSSYFILLGLLNLIQ